MAAALRKEEGLGLAVAIAAHAAIVAVLLLRPHSAPVVQPPERIQVTISDDVGLTSTSPQPQSQAAPPIAPELGEPQPQEQPQEQAQPEPEPEPAPPAPTPPKPRVQPKPDRKPEPKPAVKPQPAPRPVQRPTPPKPEAKPQPREVTRPAPPRPAARPSTPARPAATSKPASKPSTQKAPGQAAPSSRAPAKPSAKPGGSRIGANFLDGITGGQAANRTPAAAAPAASIGPAVKASLASAISRQLKPKWAAPQGPDAEELVTILSFNLNRDGTLAGTPQVVRQLGINDLNRNQAARHAEQAIRAVRLAAPFDLPTEYYDAWKRVSAFRFDKRLSQ